MKPREIAVALPAPAPVTALSRMSLDDALSAHTPSLVRRVLPWATVVALLGAGVVLMTAFVQMERPIAVDVIEVARGEVERTVASVAAGRVTARHRARVAADVIGRVNAVYARKG